MTDVWCAENFGVSGTLTDVWCVRTGGSHSDFDRCLVCQDRRLLLAFVSSNYEFRFRYSSFGNSNFSLGFQGFTTLKRKGPRGGPFLAKFCVTLKPQAEIGIAI